MPTSRHEQITKILDVIIALKPMSVLDIGVGFGKYGYLTREYLEFWDGRHRHNKGDWQRRIDGIEVFREYLNPVHDYIYDDVYVGDALQVVPHLEKRYDLVLLIDVLEHFELADGVVLVNAILSKSKGVLICVPKIFFEKEEVFGNPYELHRAQWNKEDFKKHWRCAFMPDQNKNICLVGNEAIELWQKWQRDQFRYRISRFKKQARRNVPALYWLYKKIVRR